MASSKIHTAGGAAPAAAPAVTITALAAGFLMASLDTTVMQIAGATIQQRLHTTLSQLTWAVDGYVLTFAALLMLAGGLAGRVGARRVYLGGMAVFFAASLAAAVAPTVEALIAARLVQGAGASLFIPSSLALLVRAFPERRQRTRVLGLWSAIVSSAIALGPTIGGVMVDTLGWRSIFLVNLPVGIAGMALTRRFIAPDDTPAAGTRTAPLAIPGHALLVVLLAALSFALIEGPQRGWSSTAVLTATAATLGAAGVLTVRERRAGSTVLPWAIFRGPRFSGANIVGFLFNAAFYGVLFLVGLYFQHVRGSGPLRAGLEILPMTVFIPLSNMVFSRISARFSNGPLLAVSLLVSAGASLALATSDPGTPYWMLAIALTVTGIAGGIVAPAMTAAMVDAAGPDQGGVAASVLNANRQIGTLVGIAGIGAVLGAVHDWTAGATTVFLTVAAADLAGALAAWLLIARPEKAATPPAAGPAPDPTRSRTPRTPSPGQDAPV